MKIVIKLDKAEAEGYVNFKNAVLPPGANEDEFIKTVFYMGLGQFHDNAINMMKKYVEENEDKLREDGIDVDAIKAIEKQVSKESLENKEPQ